MFTTICLVVLLVGAIAAFVYRHFQPKTVTKLSRYTDRSTEEPNPNRPLAGMVGSALLAVFLLWFVLASFVVVSTRNTGVVLTFGRPVGTLSNGLHFTWPWQTVEEMDGSIQIDKHIDDNTDGNNHAGALVVRLGNNSNAWADTSVRWEIEGDAADDLFLQYKSFNNVRDNLITRNLQVALNEVFATYNPLASVNPTDPKAPAPPPVTESQLPELAKRATDIVRAKVGDQVKIFEVQIPTIAFDQETQNKIDQLNQQRAATAVAVEALATANAQNAANKALESSLSPEVLQSKCLDVARDKGQPVLGCLPFGGGAPVLTKPVG